MIFVIISQFPFELSDRIDSIVLVRTVLPFATPVHTIPGHMFVDRLIRTPFPRGVRNGTVIFTVERHVLMPALKVVPIIVGPTFVETMRLRSVANGRVVETIGLIGRR